MAVHIFVKKKNDKNFIYNYQYSKVQGGSNM